MLYYPVGDSGQTLVLCDQVLKHFAAHRQRLPWQAEAGGQLFARLEAPDIHIVEATGPRLTDKRGRTYYRPDRRAEQREIRERHGHGLHYVGDWHTHPVRHPDASCVDLNNINDCVAKSRHELNGFVLIIVGTARTPAGLRVSVHDGEHCHVLHPRACGTILVSEH